MSQEYKFVLLFLVFFIAKPNEGRATDNAINQRFVPAANGVFVEFNAFISNGHLIDMSNNTNNNNKCGNNTNGYNWEPRTGSCYKFHMVAMPWHLAAMRCQAEGGHLAIINSAMESQILKDLFEMNPSTSIELAGIVGNSNYAGVGFWNWNKEQGGWLTVFGEPLDMAGFDGWGNDEPNNMGGEEFCGTIGRDGLFNDNSCEQRIPFICEITPLNK